jgi:LacI family transcriptional regulator
MSRRRAGAATIPEVARAAGVSAATAARALGGYGAVSESARERVLAAADELGYRRNDLARAMITGRSNTIGVVIADIENPFFARAVRSIADSARAAGYEVVLTNTDEDAKLERAAVRVLLAKQVDGLIVAPTSQDSRHLVAAQQAGCPVVLLDRRTHDLAADVALVDNYAASRDVVERLLAVGHRRIAMVTGETGGGTDGDVSTRPSLSTGRDRVEGYLAALRHAGVGRPKAYLRTDAHTPDAAHGLTRELLSLRRRPTAVFASDSRVALGVLKAIRGADLAVPQEMSMVAFDDADWTSVVTPPISVVAQPTHALGRRSAEMLLRRIAGSDEPTTVDMMTTEFIARGSVAPPPDGSGVTPAG